ncbi:hypothetical protein G7L40_20335 [Paenibacillus polymyxa]|uniref:Uncharacterized protein n=1 Tax=Paenibacillus polymyxa TaxID=1406 RepID=A0A378Y145_PAEPO|nr:hypothetical protein [Paenibacillus polymyxa]MBE7896162.1 hypothetical protein [Paenibacillus polymyxa]MBG9765892.1 hypothetical protein [Paenibacillus polymyxa]MCC3256691.1 hypothetical protein [Paenibacillus polymyxa]QPK54818.1 hypothetical protein G7035_20380 [Paenibacillus polymyxa]QPK59909.1 hypothetical protein G7L40_20335 [Paenibacillus polymyxa]
MKVKADVSVSAGYNGDYKIDSLKIKVAFKCHGKFKKIRLKKYIIIHDWSNELRSSFLEKCVELIANQELIINYAKEMIREYFEGKEEVSLERDLEMNLGASLKSINKNKIHIEVNI